MRALILISGGLGSSIALAEAVNRYDRTLVYAVHLSDGRGDKATKAARRLCDQQGVRRAFLKRPAGGFVGGVILAYGYALAEHLSAPEVWTGHRKTIDTPTGTHRPEFRDAFRFAGTLGTSGKVSLVSPWEALGDDAMLYVAARLDAPLEHSWDCEDGGEAHCRACGGCLRRMAAFALARRVDPIMEACP